MIIFFMFLLFCMVILYPGLVVAWFKLHNDKRSIIEIIRKEC